MGISSYGGGGIGTGNSPAAIKDALYAIRPNRSQVVFGVSGMLFGIGVFALIAGGATPTKKDSPRGANEFDGVALIPCIISTAVFLMYQIDYLLYFWFFG